MSKEAKKQSSESNWDKFIQSAFVQFIKRYAYKGVALALVGFILSTSALYVSDHIRDISSDWKLVIAGFIVAGSATLALKIWNESKAK